jgi:hypothetical protein
MAGSTENPGNGDAASYAVPSPALTTTTDGKTDGGHTAAGTLQLVQLHESLIAAAAQQTSHQQNCLTGKAIPNPSGSPITDSSALLSSTIFTPSAGSTAMVLAPSQTTASPGVLVSVRKHAKDKVKSKRKGKVTGWHMFLKHHSQTLKDDYIRDHNVTFKTNAER